MTETVCKLSRTVSIVYVSLCGCYLSIANFCLTETVKPLNFCGVKLYGSFDVIYTSKKRDKTKDRLPELASLDDRHVRCYKCAAEHATFQACGSTA